MKELCALTDSPMKYTDLATDLCGVRGSLKFQNSVLSCFQRSGDLSQTFDVIRNYPNPFQDEVQSCLIYHSNNVQLE